MSSAKDEYEELLFLHEEIERLTHENTKLHNDLVIAKVESDTHESGHLTMVRVCREWECLWTELLSYMYCRERDIKAPLRSEDQPHEDFALWLEQMCNEFPGYNAYDYTKHPYSEHPMPRLQEQLYEEAQRLLHEARKTKGGDA